MGRKQFTEILPDDNGEAGIHRADLANALSCWAFMQNRRTSVAGAASAFNTTPDLIRQAIDDHSWMFPEWPEGESDPSKQFIGHEGE